MRHVFLCVILALAFSACTTNLASKPYIPDFSTQTNPYDRHQHYSLHSDYNYNSFRKFYESKFLNSSLQECYINANENFLQYGEYPELINEGSIEKGFVKLRNLDLGYITIGYSSFTTFGRSDPKEALELANVLRAKYVIYEEENLGLQEDAQRIKRMRIAQTAYFLIEYPSLAEKCSRLMQEIQANKK